MAFLVDEAYLPATLTVGAMSDEAFAQLCAEHPDLNLEMSAEGQLSIMPLRVLQAKMIEWVASGAQLAWLIDPEIQTVEIHRPGQAVETHDGNSHLAADGPIDGFVLDLKPVWNPLQD